MAALRLDALPLGQLTLDYCVACRGFWFDAHESTQLAPQSVLALFTLISAARTAQALPLAGRLDCPRCQQVLLLTRDQVRSGPLTYQRCPAGHGRFTPFVQFLTEKGFVRHLAKAEVERVAVSIAQISCHACGAPIDLRRDMVCPHCRSPIAVLDAEATRHALHAYSMAAAPRLSELGNDPFIVPSALPEPPPGAAASLLELGLSAVTALFV